MGCGLPGPNEPDQAEGETSEAVSEDLDLVAHPFWLGVSYYGALHPNAQVSTDLGNMATRGFNLVRVWATWVTGSGDTSSSLTTSSSANLNPQVLSRLKTLLTTAAGSGINVDLTFDPGSPSSPPWPLYKTALTNAAAALKGRSNVFFDLCNECDRPGSNPALSVPQITELVQSIHGTGGDAARQVFVSDVHKAGETADTYPASAAARYTLYYNATAIAMAAPHFVRTCDSTWATKTDDHVNAFRAALPSGFRTRRIYLQEEHRRHDKACYDPPERDFRTAAANAKAAGAKGWTFHTSAGFDLSDGRTLFQHLDAIEKSTFTNLHTAVGL